LAASVSENEVISVNAWRLQEKTGTSDGERIGDTPFIQRVMRWGRVLSSWIGVVPGTNGWLRTIALILVITFINQDIVWAQGGSPAWSHQDGTSAFKPTTTANGNISVPKTSRSPRRSTRPRATRRSSISRTLTLLSAPRNP